MQPKDWWYLIATVASPFLAAGLTALLTLIWQDRHEKRAAKLRVFTALMASRKNINNLQTAQEWAKALNVIDVVFADSPEVLKHWHDLYLMLQQENAPPGQGHQMIELYSAMARDLGFKKISQTVIDQGHYPRAISDPVAKASEVQAEFLRVLKNTHSLTFEKKPEANSQAPKRG
jgi:hypothetical protein